MMKDALKDVDVYNDRVLIVPSVPKMKSGIIIPDSALADNETGYGLVVKKGNGYMLPSETEDGSSWDKNRTKFITPRFIPLSVSVNDFVYYLIARSAKVMHEGFEFVICPESSILMSIKTNKDIDEILTGITGNVQPK